MPKSILFLDKVLNKPQKRGEQLRGVEVFNLFFIRDLIGLGHRVTVIIDPSWQQTFETELGTPANLNIVSSSGFGGKNLSSIGPLWQIRNQRFDALFLANVGDGILIPYHFIQQQNMADRTTLLAHKVPGSFFVKNLRKDTTVVSVNRNIADPFASRHFPINVVYYGILNTDQYHPPATKRQDDIIRFGMLGDLDSEWKGSDTAIEAFLKLPKDLADRSELHLAAFLHNPPAIDDPRIHIHTWIDRDQLGTYLRSLDIMLCLSRDLGRMMETFCQTMVQGMLCGLPQITTNLDIFTEKIASGGGIATTNQDQLISAMIDLAHDPQKRARLGHTAAQTAQQQYVWNSEYFVDKYL